MIVPRHKYDPAVGLRLPEEFRALEPEIRKVLGEHLSRGKVDINLRYWPAPGTAASGLVLNRPLVDRLVALQEEVRSAAGRTRSAPADAAHRRSGQRRRLSQANARIHPTSLLRLLRDREI